MRTKTSFVTFCATHFLFCLNGFAVWYWHTKTPTPPPLPTRPRDDSSKWRQFWKRLNDLMTAMVLPLPPLPPPFLLPPPPSQNFPNFLPAAELGAFCCHTVMVNYYCLFSSLQLYRVDPKKQTSVLKKNFSCNNGQKLAKLLIFKTQELLYFTTF
jgi:hypothetical protein